MSWLAALSGIGTIGQSLASIYNTNKTIQANKSMAEYSYSKDLEMWNRQNEYNTPQAQMSRFKEAGLNPNLIYGKGNPGNATVLPKYNVPKLEYNYQVPDILNIIQGLQSVRESNKRIEETNQRINESGKRMEKIDQDIWESQERIDYLGKKNRLTGYQAWKAYMDVWGSDFYTSPENKKAIAYARISEGNKYKFLRDSPYMLMVEARRKQLEQMTNLYQAQTNLRDLDADWYMWNNLSKPIGSMIKLLIPGGSFYKGSKFLKVGGKTSKLYRKVR